MHTLNHKLEKSILEADGRYLGAQELSQLEHYARSYAVRLQTYQQLRDNSDKFILQALRKLAQSYPELIQQHGQRCKYDMTEVLRYVALSILRDDEIFFKEQIMSWLDTILLAHKRTAHCVLAYRYLQEAIATVLSNDALAMTRPYFDLITQSLEAHV
ncbi:phycobilisome protein [Phormidium sp. FACHB-592]|uniref:Phycobilisome protein n=1 Tax=Stenomitos frigidus AS-A4 TaxID=2933935 RepID=A0ABV0KMT5_9CYAN|nr:phycobilisome protein [Phormidium sp. FACHB-592]MBD2074836.1 phycobilisome protein [Phormidium sp. FACHB-592]